MTNNQVNYLRYREDARHNKATEAEGQRHNRVSESNEMGKAIIDATMRKYASDKSYASNIYSADTNLAGTKYSADTHYMGTRYSADSSLAGTKYSSDLKYASSIYSADRSYASSVYSADRSYAANKYSADMKYASSIYGSNLKYSTDLASIQQKEVASQRDYETKHYQTDVQSADKEKDRQFKGHENYAERRLGYEKLSWDKTKTYTGYLYNMFDSIAKSGYQVAGKIISALGAGA